MKKKNYLQVSGLYKIWKSKLFVLMRAVVFLIVISIAQTFAINSYSQNTRLSLSENNQTIMKILENIEDQSEFYFMFDATVVDLNHRVSINCENKSINDILDQIFKNTDITYKIEDRQIALSNVNMIRFSRQQISVSGTVSDQSGSPLPGVTVVVKGTTQGTITDADGNYSLSNVSGDATLVFSFVGMKTQEIPVAGKTKINIILAEETMDVEEVVVVGYGTQKKINLTGSIDVVGGDELANRPAANVGEVLQGVSPNLNIGVSVQGGEPGSNTIWNIRGNGRLGGNTSPLVLIDGVESDVNSLDPESIESISVLKDAASSAIYGARAPFGVILITTKKGKKGDMRLTYNTNVGFTSPVNLPEFADSYTLATAFNQACDNAGIAHKFSDEQMVRIKGYIDGTYPTEYDPDNPPTSLWMGRHMGNANYEWIDEYFKDFSPRQKHSLNLDGGNEKTQYYVSTGFFDQNGVLEYGNDSYKRYNILANITSQVSDWIRFNFSTKYALTKTDHPVGALTLGRYYLLQSMMTFWPTMPKYNADGTVSNPIIVAYRDGARELNTSNDSWITVGAELEPVKGWKTNTSYNYNYQSSRNTKHAKEVWVPVPNGSIGNIGQGVSGFEEVFGYNYYSLFNITSSYERLFKGHNLMAMVGYEKESSFYSSLSGGRTQLISHEVPSISTALGENPTVDDAMGHWATQAIFGRFTYNYNEKYLLEINTRYNGSSRFADGKRWGFFPSLSVGYNINKENFWAGIEPYVNTLKIRGSYGSLGNQNVPNYLYLSNIPINSELPYIIGNNRPLYADAPGIISSTLTWETVTTLDIGLDASFLNQRLGLMFDWYNRKTVDMFGPTEELPAVLGISAPQENNAELGTKGWEVSLTWKDRTNSGIGYDVKFTLGDYKSTVLKYRNVSNGIDTWYEGMEIGEIWGYTTDGFIQAEGEAMPDQSKFYHRWGPGDIKYKDLNGDEIINDGTRTVDDHGDISVIGNITPRYNYSISGGLNWKGVDFSMFWQGVAKRDFFPTYSDWSSNVFWGLNQLANNSSIFKGGQLDYWRPANDNTGLGANTDAYYPKPYFSAETAKNRLEQTKYLQDASYLRLKNIQVGYTIPQKITRKINVEKLRIYFSGENMLTFTKMNKYLDPETAVVSDITVDKNYDNDQQLRGIGRIYPLQRTLSLGLNLTF